MSAIPLRTDYDAASVRSLARKASDADQVRRLLAIEQPDVWRLGFPLISHPGIPI